METKFQSLESGVRLLIFLLCTFSASVSAHPHLFIDIMAKFMLTDSMLSGVNVFWDFDEMYSATLIEEFDVNGNGTFEKPEYVNIQKEAFSYTANSNYFMVVTWKKNLLQVTETKHFVATILPDKKIRYSFFVPFDIRLSDLADTKLVMSFNDPSMYIAFDLKKKMIQSGRNNVWEGTVSFEKEDYYDLIIFRVKRNAR